MMRANLQLTDYDAEGRPRVEDLELVPAPLSPLLTMELDGAVEVLGLTSEEILLGALGRAIERTIGSGQVTVDVPGYGARVHPLTVQCAAPRQIDADGMLTSAHHALAELAVRRMVHGVPDDPRPQPVSDVLFASGDTAVTRPYLGHLLELRAYCDQDVMALDWWFDARSFESYTVAELAEQFPLALIELTSEATPPVQYAPKLAVAH
ncbi:hypothetical protein [Mycobacterium antarcticum]|uniref:hypothetical protein n=1 Tax=Mycolicibacterium sp. TUM20985 TaxID=3023370 RepID=UPI002572364D|nr:hypothetical protein [Mycolicibacterium sp. TUM20985]